MQKSTKLYLAFCLISLQLIAPFIHAHALGLDAFKEHVAHFHTDLQVYSADGLGQNIKSADTTFKIDHQFVPQASASEQKSHGYVVTIADGMQSQLDYDILLNQLFNVAILSVFAFILFEIPRRFTSQPPQSLFYRRSVFSSQSPRAPPR